MVHKFVLVCLFGISACFVSRTVARVAIVGGGKAGVHEFQYQVSLQQGSWISCGGGIIDDLHILTAAHCVVQHDIQITKDHITILAGTHDLHKAEAAAVKVQVKKIFVPKEYNINDSTSPGDIAILKLLHPLDSVQNKHLKHLELPKNEHEHYIGKRAKIAGFGWNWIQIHINNDEIDRTGGNNDFFLRFVETDVLNHLKCQKDYKNHHLNSDKQFCARAKHHDDSTPHGVCNGDSGGPLVHDGKTVIGVLSAGSPICAETSWAGLYTSVAHYLAFIEHARHDKPHQDIRTRDLHP